MLFAENNIMKKYIIHRKCVATEFVSIKANSEKEAMDMVEKGEGKAHARLEFRGHLPRCCWTAEDISTPLDRFDSNILRGNIF